MEQNINNRIDKEWTLSPDGLQSICSACYHDAAQIGNYFLELLSSGASVTGKAPGSDVSEPINRNWLYAQTEEELTELLDMFWGFHDFRIERVDYNAASDRIDLHLEYDTHEYRVLLRFMGNVSMNFLPVGDYAVDWLFGASLGIDSKHRIVWVGDDDILPDERPDDVLWIAGDVLHYALLDDDGNPRALPEELLHQTWYDTDLETGKKQSTDHEFHPKYLFE